jgi:protein involved in polysaccharide export with SLBB domain
MSRVLAKKIPCRLCVNAGRARWRCAGLMAATVMVSASLWAQEPGLSTETDQNAAEAGAPEGRSALSSDAIISRLREQPELLVAAKNAAAVRLSVDPGTVSDAAIYDQIRRDPNLRLQITQELKRRGYDVSAEAESDLGGAKRDLATGSRDNLETRLGEESSASDLAPRRMEAGRGIRRTISPPQPDTQRNDDDNAEPGTVRRPNPYAAVPSLNDLYSQFPSSEVKLKRFGSNVFRLGTGNANDLPMDLPVGADYVLGPGDGLILNLWGSVSQRLSRTIDRQGQVALPEAGTVSIAGLTIAQAQEKIQKTLEEQFQNIHVEISLARLRTVRVYVVGDVQRPGAYDISSLSTPLNALYAAGGPTSSGSLRIVRHGRGKELVRELDLYDFLLRGVRSEIDRLLPGDTVLVPPVGPQVAVSGMVRRPAIYELKGEQSLKEVIDLAGGVLVSAALRQIRVERIDAHQRHTMVSAEMSEDGAGDGTLQELASFPVQDGDRVLVSSILPYNEKAVYLEGHVFRPGRYPYRDGITVNELLRSYQDLLPEPAEHAEIVRLQAPDFRPTTISFNLSDVLAGDDPITLAPFDVIRVFSRYEIDPPKVSIRGEVLRPGEYPLTREMTAAGLVNMAGGFKRSAYREQADLSSYAVENGQKVVAAQRVIEIGRALEGDPGADIALKPGDLVSIRQLTGWEDIGSSVAVSGEVMYPGTYGIAEGERLSSVLKRVGGFRPSAYPAGAVLERVQVREMSEKARLEMIRRVETANPGFNGSMQAAQEQVAMLQAMEQQRQQILASLRQHPASGRQVIRVSGDLSKWENTPADIEMRAGDVLVIPKRPNFVMVGGQVYNATAISYVRGKNAGWYLRQAGGPTPTANRKGIFILRADGSVVGRSDSFAGLWRGNVLSTPLQPGDSIVVPEKISGGSMLWKNLMAGAQLASSAATVGLTAAYLGR